MTWMGTFRAFILMTIVLMTSVSGSVVYGQGELPVLLPPLTKAESQVATLQPTLPPNSEPQTLSSSLSNEIVVPDGFWIVSSRRLCQERLQNNSTAWMDYFHWAPGCQMISSNQASFQNWLQPGIPICVYVHGSFVTWETVLEDSCDTYRWIKKSACGRPVQVVFFTWPSDEAITGIPLLDAKPLGERAGFNGLYLHSMLESLPYESPLSIIGHSHGARVVVSSMHLRGGGEVDGYRVRTMGQRRIRVVLAAAAIDHDWLCQGHRYECALNPIECMLNLRNHHDAALAVYPWIRPFSRRAAGKAGFTRHDVRNIGPQAVKISEIDVTDSLRLRHVWPYYLADDRLGRAVSGYLYFAGG